jgi:hypothetical protein
VELGIGHLAEPDQRRQVVADDVLAACRVLLRKHALTLDEVWQRNFDMLLEEVLARHAVRVALERERAIAQMRRQEWPASNEIFQQVAFREPSMAMVRGPENPLRMGHADQMLADLQLISGKARLLELPEQAPNQRRRRIARRCRHGSLG